MHVLKTEPVIGQLGFPIGSVGLLLHLSRVIVLRGDAPSGGNAPADQVGRWVWSMGLSTGRTCSGASVHPPASLPLLWVHSRGSWGHKGLMGDRARDRGRRGILDRGDDGGRGPG